MPKKVTKIKQEIADPTIQEKYNLDPTKQPNFDDVDIQATLDEAHEV